MDKNLYPSVIIPSNDDYLIRTEKILNKTNFILDFYDNEHFNKPSTEKFSFIKYTTNGSLSVACNPKNCEELCLICYNDINQTLAINTYQYNQKEKTLTFLKELPSHILPHNFPFFCQYSPDGSRIIIANERGIHIVNLHRDCTVSLSKQNTTILKSIAIHRYCPIITTLSKYNNIITFWDIDTLECTCTLFPCNSTASTDEYDVNKKLMDISPDGTKLLVAFDDQCVIIPIPLTAILSSLDKRKVLTTYLLLQHYHLDHYGALPKDIAQLLTYYLTIVLKDDLQ